MSLNSKGSLSGIRILDLTRVLAGPYCSMLLGDMGAQVLKVEKPLVGDDTRQWGPPFAPNLLPNQPLETAYFLGINRNKKSITCNIQHPKGVEIITKLASISDVLIENYIPGKLESLGLGYDTLKKINPRLIYCSISGYGPTGPYSKQAGYDVVTEAEAGLMHITGEADGPPVKVGVAITDLTTGLYAHGAILSSIIARYNTGVGQKIDLSLLECQVANLANVAHNYLIGNIEAKRWGTQHSSIVPYQSFKTKDGYIVIGAGNDHQFSKLCIAFSKSEWATNAKFKTNSKRVENRKELVNLIESVLKTQETAHWLEIMKNLGIPFGPVNTIKETFDHPQVIHRDMIVKVDHPKCGEIKLVGPAVKYSESPCKVFVPPPTLGEHTREILKDICGYSQATIDGFVKDGVV